ncbi:MAG: lipid-A-disaccharide synthase, partial [Rhodospirillaceae bacterium]
SLLAETGGQAKFAGVGGPQMAAAGLDSLFNPAELALLGIFEVVPKARQVFKRVADVLADIERVQPDVLVTIDSWGFTGRIHQRLARGGSTIPRVRYVAPQVWAWRPGRAKQLSKWIHHLLPLVAVAPPLFRQHGLAATWVGHPVVESGVDKGDGAAFRLRHGIGKENLVLGVLPGSRAGEVTRLLPVFRQAISLLSQSHGSFRVVV